MTNKSVIPDLTRVPAFSEQVTNPLAMQLDSTGDDKQERFNDLWRQIEAIEPKKEYSDPVQALQKVAILGQDLHFLRLKWIELEKYCFHNNLFELASSKIETKLEEAGPMRSLLNQIQRESGEAKDLIEKLQGANNNWLEAAANLLKALEKIQFIICTFPANMYFSVLGIGLKLWQGRCYGMRGEFQKANECFQKGVESFQNFEHTIANVERAMTQLPPQLMKMLDGAIPQLAKLLHEKDVFVHQTLPSFKTTMRFSIIIMYIMNGDITNAIQWFNGAWNDLTKLEPDELPSAFHSSPIVPHLSPDDVSNMNEIKTTLDNYLHKDIPVSKRAFVNNILGILCQQLRQPEYSIMSEKYHVESLRWYEQCNNVDSIIASHFNLGYVALFIRPQADLAKQHFSCIKQLASVHDKNGELQRATILLGFAHLLDEHYSLAIEELVNPTCQTIKEEYFVIMRLYGLALAHWKLNQLAEAKENITRCINSSKRTLNNASNSRLVLSAFELHHQLSQLHQLIHVSLGDIPSAIEVSDWFKLSLTSLSYNADVHLRHEDAVKVSQVQALLDQASAIVVYSSCKDVFNKTSVEYIYLVTKTAVKAFERSKNKKRYSVVSVNDIAGVTRGVPTQPVDIEEEDMYPLLLHEALKPFAYVGFVFQGKWSNPAAFNIPDTDKYLIEEKHVCILPSLFWFVKQRNFGFLRGVALDNNSAALLGGLTTANLDQVQDEIHQIEEFLKIIKPKKLISNQFCRDQVIDALSNKLLTLIHLANHNKPEGDGSTYYELSGKIQLSGKELLKADDILTCTNLEKLKLVTLSCCSTAEGAEVSIGPLGIYMSFIVVGAECVVATLTSIKDEAAKALMTSFYKRVSEGKTKIVAYRETVMEYFQSNEWKNYVFAVKYIQVKNVGTHTQLKGDQLLAKIEQIADEFNNQPLKPRCEYWVIVSNQHPDLTLTIRGKIKFKSQKRYLTHTFFRVKTPQTKATDATFEFRWPTGVKNINVRVRKEPLIVEEPNDSDSSESSQYQSKPRINLLIGIRYECFETFHNILLNQQFKLEYMSMQAFYTRKQHFEWHVVILPYSDDQAPDFGQYLRMASEAVVFLVGNHPDHPITVIDRIFQGTEDLLQHATRRKTDVTQFYPTASMTIDLTHPDIGTLSTIKSAFAHPPRPIFDVVSITFVEHVASLLTSYFHKWLSLQLEFSTVTEFYLCFEFEDSGSPSLNEVLDTIHNAIDNVSPAAVAEDIDIENISRGSIVAYISCSASALRFLLMAREKLVKEFQASNLQLRSIYEATISDIAKSIARDANAQFREELEELKQRMIVAGVKESAENRSVYFTAKPEKPTAEEVQQPADFMVEKHVKALTNRVKFTEVTRGSESEQKSPLKLALLIGINKYFYIKGLEGAVNDVKLMKKTLIEKFGFKEENMITLIGDENTDAQVAPTRKNILAAFARIIELTKKNAGAIITVHYSGHGSVRLNTNHPTGQNETIVPCDSGRLKKDGGLIEDPSQVPPSTDIVDEEIRSFLAELSQYAAHVSVLFDSCHSESVTRDPVKLAGARTVSYDSRLGQVPTIKKDDRPHDYSPSFNNVVVIAACAYNRLAYEVKNNFDSYGALTYYWCEALRTASTDEPVTYGDIFGQIFPKFDTNKQTPKIEGERSWQLYGTAKLESHKFAVVIDQDGDDVQLDVGSVHAVTQGSVFALFSPNIRVPSDVHQITATVVFVGSTTCWASLHQNVTRELKGYRAFEIQRADENRIAIKLPSTCPENVRAELGGKFREVEQNNAELIMHEVRPGEIRQFKVQVAVPQSSKPALVITDKNNNILLPVDTSDKKEVTVSNLLAYAQYQMHLHNHNDVFWQDEIEFVVYHSKSKFTPVQQWPEIRGKGELVEGEYVRFGMRQQTQEKLYFAIIQFDENGGIQQLYPADNAETSPLPIAEHLLSIPDNNKAYGPVSIDKTIPRPASDVVKVAFKLYVTTEPTNYSYIRQEGYSPTRGLGPQMVSLVDSVQWTSKTIWCTLKHK